MKDNRIIKLEVPKFCYSTEDLMFCQFLTHSNHTKYGCELFHTPLKRDIYPDITNIYVVLPCKKCIKAEEIK